jgi:hypothetical protein
MKEAIYYGVPCSVIHPAFNNTPMISNSAVSGEL